ncbi:acyl-CoA dehydrogenase [Saxibacter everestensis]|uniref:Acyl-CoA dehydrogenase n=1 Tax=Saxibacter everestensis TaxID=2909229 RepID=A0ABY8QSL6_9MICO|nr:acyl-CoA dehydrogenase [Brevibacteriaceae bacterium ZFBP1038]
MSHYKSNLRDIYFNLFEVFNRQEILGSGPYEDVDPATAKEILSEINRLAGAELSDSLLDSDRNPPVFNPEDYSVTLPESFKNSYKTFVDSGWWQLEAPEEFGGTAVPPSLRWAAAELILGANPAIHMYASFASFSKILLNLGTEDQRRLAAHMVENKWGATMVLTEPDAGSDVGAGRTKAVQQADGSWHLTGVKRFITSGEHDLSDNIIHFVLARPEGTEGAGGPGTKGLSLFIVPKFHVDLETGELGERNGAYVTNVEHKMGLKVSTTTEVRFGEVDGVPAVGTLLGDVHDGIRQMFHVIEYARMMVGSKAIATLSTGYLNALEYAKERVQGPDLAKQSDKASPRVTITHHPDVRRSLMTQKAYAEGLRALVALTATVQDRIELAERAGAEPDPLDVSTNDLLLPIVKGYGSERSWVLLGTESLQTFGGSGFLQDYPVEQYVRDAKIDTLYEGTTAIQGMDFFFRKIVKNKGAALGALSAEIQAFAESQAGGAALAAERALLGRALGDVGGLVATLTGFLQSADPRVEGGDINNIYRVGQNTSRLLLAVGDVAIAWLLLRQAVVANEALAGDVSGADRDFYLGKVAAARFFARQVLPKLTAERKIAEATDNELMELPEAAF